MEEVHGATEGEGIVSGLFPEEFEEVDRLTMGEDVEYAQKFPWMRPAVEEEEEEVVFTRDNRGGSAQHATRATPIRSSHGPMRA